MVRVEVRARVRVRATARVRVRVRVRRLMQNHLRLGERGGICVRAVARRDPVGDPGARVRVRCGVLGVALVHALARRARCGVGVPVGRSQRRLVVLRAATWLGLGLGLGLRLRL